MLDRKTNQFVGLIQYADILELILASLHMATVPESHVAIADMVQVGEGPRATAKTVAGKACFISITIFF